jgi:hypothetical protein
MVASLAWGGYRNGFIPADALRSIGRGFLLEARAAAQFLAARAFLIAFYGIDPLDYVSETYRDWDGQVYQKRRWTQLGKPWNAADPGFSIHGWAKAIDFNVDAMTEDIYNIIMAVLARYGFIRDVDGESWHTSFREASITVTASSDTTPFEEDLLSALTDQEQRELLETQRLLSQYLLLPRAQYPSTVDQTLETFDKGRRDEQDRVEVRDNVRWIVYNLMARTDDSLVSQIVRALPQTIDIGELSAALVNEIEKRVAQRSAVIDAQPRALDVVPASNATPTA